MSGRSDLANPVSSSFFSPTNLASSRPAESYPASRTLKFAPLLAPGPDSNYLDWVFVVSLFLRSGRLDYVLWSVSVKDRPPSWEDDNVTVCSLLSQNVDKANFKHIRESGRMFDAAGMWTALKRVHEYQTSGVRIHWLYKMVLIRMDDDEDIEGHIEKMHRAYEKLNALITSDRPLTADDIFATALVISLPPKWLASIRNLMQQPSTTSETIISALRNEANYNKTMRNALVPEESAAFVSSNSSSTPSFFCSFCENPGHDLDHCKTASKILSQAKDSYNEERRVQNELRAKGRSRPGRSRKTKAGKAKAVALLESDEEEDDASSDIIVNVAKVGVARAAKSMDATIDSGCSKSMTPHSHQLTNLRPQVTPIWLADDSVIRSTHCGTFDMPLPTNSTHSALLVPDLQEPLLSVSGLCDDGLAVLFENSGCRLFDSDSLTLRGKQVASGERRGNLYHLPNELEDFSRSAVPLSSNHNSLFD